MKHEIVVNSVRSNNKNINNILNIYYGIVIDNEDSDDLMRLKVRIDGLDNDIDDKDLPYSLPLIPKFFHIIPKLGEAVRVLIADLKRPLDLRIWVGSVISQPQLLEYDPYFYSALTGSSHQTLQPLKSTKNTVDGKELYPQKEDVAILGRYNTDIIQRRNEVLIRCGIRDKTNKLKLNRKNPSYLKMFYNQDDIATTMLVSERIGIMTHNGVKKFNPILTNDDVNKFFNEAHALPKGDILVKALNVIRDVIIDHVHGGANTPANNSNLLKRLKDLNFENILSENIKIN